MKVLARTLARETPIGAPISNHRFLDHLETRGHTVHRCWNLPNDLADFDVLVMGGTTVEGFAIKAARSNVKVVAVVHSGLRSQLAGLVDLVVWNTEADRQNRPGIVCHPPTDPADYATTPGDRVTLVNLSEEKGGELFDRIARGMPDTKFLGVTGGYGRQYPQRESNVDVIPSTHNMRDDVYARTRVLLMPSSHESWGMVGVEAMASGIPVIAHPTPGLRESLGDAGIFIDRANVHAWIAEVERLEDPIEYAEASTRALARSAELDPAESLDRFATAVEKLGPPPSERIPPRVAVIGTGRSGTGYLASLLGFGHEKWWNPMGRRTSGLAGDVSWLALPAIEAGEHDGPVLHVTRHPVDVVRSLAGIGFFAGSDERDPDSLFRSFALEHCPEADLADPVDAAVEWWVNWNERCAEVADFTVRLEAITAQDPDVVDIVAEITGVPVDDWTEPPTDVNSRAGQRSRTTAKRIWRLLDGRADRFGYESD